MRPLRVLVGLAAALLPASAVADPVPLDGASAAARSDVRDASWLVERERAPIVWLARAASARIARIAPPERAPGAEDVTSPLDCEHAEHDIRVDPMSGVTSATLSLAIRARDRSLSSIGFAFDEGLELDSASADDRTVTAEQEVYTPSRVVRIDLSPALAPGESTVVHLAYSGTLACNRYPEAGGVVCTKGRAFSYFAYQSIFPNIFDPDAPSSETLDVLTREIVLRVPAGNDLVATGELVSERVDERGDRVSRWSIDRPLSRALALYAFAGQLGRKAVAGRSVPTTLVFPAPEQDVDGRLARWSSPVLDFVEASAGSILPFQRSMSLVRLPSEVGDPGTATFGMTLLSDAYANAGDLIHEETWAHENSHLFWGIVVPEKNSLESRLMSEGMATLTEIDYTRARHFGGADRDRYLARRFVPIGLDLRSVGSDLPPVRLAPGQLLPAAARSQLYTVWAYEKTAATLDHLRVTVGDDTFSRGLREYVDRCSFVGCRPDDLRVALEEVSGKDLHAFFARWVDGSSRPEVTISFARVEGGVEIELAKQDGESMTLELWIELFDGGLLKRRVDLSGRTTRVRIDTPGKARSVSTSPRHDVFVDARSTVDGDIDFDGETDGFDILRCARLVGTRYAPSGNNGLWDLNESFDPRCDLDDDLDIDDDDIERLTETFGKLREGR